MEARASCACWVAAWVCAASAFADGPGLVVIVGEEPQQTEFTVPATSSYKFDYDPGRISLWDTPAKDNLIPPGVVFTAPGSAGDSDLDGDIDLHDFSLLQVCFSGEGGGPSAPECEVLDFDSDTDVDLADYSVFWSVLTGPPTALLGDLDADGRVDLDDFATFAGCVGGPPVIVAAEFDRDGDVHLDDFTSWEGWLSGPGATPGAQCEKPDLDGDNDVDLFDLAPFRTLFAGAPATSPDCDSADLDEDADVDLGDFGVFQVVFGASQQGMPVAIVVFVEGLTASTALGDVVITLLVDPDGDDVFEPEATQAVTVVSIDLAPSSGALGTPVTVTMSPAIAPLAFDAATTADWEGVYQPPVGPPTDVFQVAYDVSQFRESSLGDAIIVVGDGTFTNAPDPSALEGPGTMAGTLTINFAGLTVGRGFTFAQDLGSAGLWEGLDYVFDPDTGLMEPPRLAGEPEYLDMMDLSNDLAPFDPNEFMLLQSYTFHLAVVTRIEENPTTVSDAPQTILVDLVSYDTSGAELDRVEDVVLTMVSGDDGDADHLVYHSNLDTPVIFVDVALNKDNYPNVILLQTEAGGTVSVVAAVD
ncbi:MAG TPA: hypothetical protein VM243_00870 [Phycisphaerae bacterium]|nr:hypothetical protein [Phycisphaerae bacterium]